MPARPVPPPKDPRPDRGRVLAGRVARLAPTHRAAPVRRDAVPRAIGEDWPHTRLDGTRAAQVSCWRSFMWAGQHLLKRTASAYQEAFQRLDADAENPCGLGITQSLVVAQGQGGPLLHRQP